jgi:ribosomal protein S18 acetylase RimI-like enzyme
MTDIKTLRTHSQAEICARMMSESEPWITLKRDYRTALRIITDPTREVYLAWQVNEIAGFTILLMQGALVGYIQSVCVAPAWRNQGIGSKLIRYAEKRILRDAPNIFIMVSDFNPAALRLYQRLGFEIIGEITDYIIPNHSEILMRKSINPLTEFKAGNPR